MSVQVVTRKVRFSIDEKNPLDRMRPHLVHFVATVALSVDVDTIAYRLAMKAAKTKKKRARIMKGLIVAELTELERLR